MASVSSMNNACFSNISSHVLLSNRDQHQQLYNGTLSYKWMERHSSSRKKRFGACRIVSEKPDIDFSDPDWKAKYQKDFESKFNLPHLKDVLDVKPRPTTFSLMQREGARWAGKESVTDSAEKPKDRINDYVDNDDRTLLKVIKYASPTSAGAECIDPNCTWVEQWWELKK